MSIKEAICRGKVRGLTKYCEIDGEEYYLQYALKKSSEKYYTLFFKVPTSKMDVIEDYAEEELSIFDTMEEAIEYFRSKNVNVDEFKPMKGVLPL